MYIADLHIHSRFSRATSKEGDAPHLDLWARRKGIGLVGTGDFTHPAWREELRRQLAPAEPGFYTLRPEYALPDATLGAGQPRFVVTGEISCIYKKGDRVRKVHNLILLPGLDEADELARRLEAVGNLHSDGRPILGMDSRDLLELTLECCPDAMFIPAHIWTPHFAMFGAFSGFDTVAECFGDLAGHIHAVETGLSSDPPMNWRVSGLDGLTLVSHSDAHSPAKLGREANLLDCELAWPALKKAIETGEGFGGTIEFFPEEGKYHLDGHRACSVCLTPQETLACGGRCPACGKKITIGVEHRVEALADRPAGYRPQGAKPFESLVPLQETAAAVLGVGAASKKAEQTYFELLAKLGPEFYTLRQAPLEDLNRAAGPVFAEGVRRLRAGQVLRRAGYDGVYGVIGLFEPEELEELNGQTTFLAAERKSEIKQAGPRWPANKIRLAPGKPDEPAGRAAGGPQESGPLAGLNPEQAAAASAPEAEVAVVAGPGTGKTKTLTARILWLLEQGAKPGQITAVTFTRQAAAELRERLEEALGGKAALRGMTIGTFHSVCLEVCKGRPLLAAQEQKQVAAQLRAQFGLKGTDRRILEGVSRQKNGLPGGAGPEVLAAYEELLRRQGARDLDDLLLDALRAGPGRSQRFCHLLVDEFQDTSEVQLALIEAWHTGGRSLFVIGDPDQAIYGFRGAAGRCFERLGQAYPALRRVALRKNYRSAPPVLGCARALIEHNPGGPRVLEAVRAGGRAVRLLAAPTAFAEGVFLAKEIARRTGGMDMLTAQPEEGERTYAFSEMAVLARTHRQLELIEQCLRHDDIPCLVIGREGWLEDPAVGRALAALEEKAAAGAKEKPLRLAEEWMQENGRSPALEKLAGAAACYPTAAALLEALTHGGEGDVHRRSGKQGAAGAVRLMTLHGAKGLEFPLVFLAGVSAGQLPLERPGQTLSADEREEERRLFFVGVTRARDELVLTAPGAASPFAAELGGGAERGRVPGAEPRPRQLSFF